MGVLADLDINILQLQDGMMGFSSYAQELKWLVTDPNRIDQLSEIIKGYSANGNTLVLIDRLTAGKRLAEIIDDSVFIQGETKLALSK